MQAMMSRTLIIAEAGVNHNGDMELAHRLIDAAVDAGADMVKFQSFNADRLVHPDAKKAEYQKRNINDGDDSQYAMLKSLELSHDQHLDLIDYCKKQGIFFFSTAFDEDGLIYLNGLGFDMFKVPSGEITNYPYLKTLARLRKPVILSTGMSEMHEVRTALDIITSEGLSRNEVTVLHCNTEYPTPFADVNLRAMNTMAQELGVKVGYSDHTPGVEVSIAAVALGAVVIEKHFTLDRTLPGPDHQASLEPLELKHMVHSIRNIELAISGDGLKKPSISELPNRGVVRKSLHALSDIKEGEILSWDKLTCLRPGTGISPMQWESVIGRKALIHLSKGQMISPNDLD